MVKTRLRQLAASFERRVALRYLNRVRQQHLSRFPQVAAFSFDYISNCIAVNGRYEDHHLSKLESLVRTLDIKGVALDIGANIGNHSLALSQCFDAVLSFEPNPFLYKLLQINCSLRDNIECLPFGLSDRPDTIDLWFDRHNFGGGSTDAARADTNSISVQVELKPLDALGALLPGPIGLIKIDVEGQEAAVLEGGKQMIRRDRPVIVFEIIPSDVSNGTSSVIEWLRREGYSRFGHIDDSPLRQSNDTSDLPKELNKIDNLTERFYQMVVALP